MGIKGIPSSHPVTTADWETTFTISLRVFTGVLRNVCFSSPKQGSGVNLVWPTIMKDKEMESLSPTVTLQQRYYKVL